VVDRRQFAGEQAGIAGRSRRFVILRTVPLPCADRFPRPAIAIAAQSFESVRAQGPVRHGAGNSAAGA